MRQFSKAIFSFGIITLHYYIPTCRNKIFKYIRKIFHWYILKTFLRTLIEEKDNMMWKRLGWRSRTWQSPHASTRM